MPPRWRGALLLVAAAVFVGGTVWSWVRLDVDLATVRWWPLVVVALVLVPATVAVNVAELVALGRIVGVRLLLRDGVKVVVLATAANFLPLPGAAAVRIHALATRGARLGAATGVNLVAAVAWVAVALVVAGVAGTGVVPVAGTLLLAGGLGLLGLSWLLLRRFGPAPGAVGALLAVEVATVAGHALRLGLVLVALRQAASVAQVLVLGTSGPLAAAAGIFPSGLGLAEALAAALAELVALAPAAGFVATAVNRVLGVAVTAPLALALGVDELRGHGRSDGA